MTVENFFFQKKGFTRFITSTLNANSEFMESLMKDIEENAQKNKNFREQELNLELTSKRLFDYIQKIYLRFEDDDWDRITEERIKELTSLLQKGIKRENFFPDEFKPKQVKKRQFVLTSLKLKNWHIFPEMEINFKDPKKIKNSKQSQLLNNIIIFIGKNSEGKSAIFDAIKMGFLGPNAFFPTISNKSRLNQRILEYVNKKSIKEAQKNKTEHNTMEITLNFKVSEPKPDQWVEYSIKRIWSIKVPTEEASTCSIYNYEEKFQRLNMYGTGNHQDLDNETFKQIFEKFIPPQLQSYFVINKSLLSSSLMEEKKKLIRNTVFQTSEYETFQILLNLIEKVKNYVIKQEEEWYTEHIKKDSEKIKELRKLADKHKKEVDSLKIKKVKGNLKIVKIEEDIDDLSEQIKDYNEKKANKYVEFQKKEMEIEGTIQKQSTELNKKISNLYVDQQVSSLINWFELKEKLVKVEEMLPEIPEKTKFDQFSEYREILKQIIKNKLCICETFITDEMESKFLLQLSKKDILSQHQLISQLFEDYVKYPIELIDNLDDLVLNSKNISDLEKKVGLIQQKMKKIKPTKFRRDVEAKIGEIEKLKNELKRLKKIKESIDINIEDKKNSVNEYEIELEDLKVRQENPKLSEEQDKYKEMKFFTDLCKITLEKLKNLYEFKLREDVGILITSYFKNIDWEGKFWEGFTIDEDWNIHFVNKENQTISLPSDGQKKIIIISFISALIDIHRFKIPWIMDNVLSELSDLNIEGFAEQIKKNMNFPQQIFFFSETEWGDIKKFLKGSVLQGYTFNKISATQSRIKEVSNFGAL